MKTQKRIMIVVGACAAAVALVATGAIVAWGWNGVLFVVAAAVMAAVIYVDIVRPWHTTWGATTEEILGELPGDELVDGASTTRAITIHASPDEVWPWIVQIGYGRAGWYSYDWIDNDGVRSATTIDERWQHLGPGDRIAMTPELGFTVTDLEPQQHIVSLSDDGSTSWTLSLAPCPAGTRLVSRFTAATPRSPAAVAWTLLADPGAFIMERRMLVGIRHRAQAVVPARTEHLHGRAA